MMLRILTAARTDLLEGFDFHQSPGPGLGFDFIEALYEDIEVLQTPGRHLSFPKIFIDPCHVDFLSRYTTALKQGWSSCEP